ncbi:unnamed protein product, partial [Polarella glacialis]
DTAVRHGFIRKVYGILGAQLVLTTLIAGLIVRGGSEMIHKNPGLSSTMIVSSCFVSLAIMMVFLCCPETMRSSPTNYILLVLFTVAESVMVGFICLSYTMQSVLFTLGVTAFIVIALSLFACQTKYDFTGFAPYIFAFAMVMMCFSLVLMILSMCGLSNSPAFKMMNIVYACLGTLVSSFYIIFDTQMIVGGKHSKYSFSLDDYCMAAINIYLDIIQLFLFLLQLLGDRK